MGDQLGVPTGVPVRASPSAGGLWLIWWGVEGSVGIPDSSQKVLPNRRMPAGMLVSGAVFIISRDPLLMANGGTGHVPVNDPSSLGFASLS
jgi:hypothetical protein